MNSFPNKNTIIIMITENSIFDTPANTPEKVTRHITFRNGIAVTGSKDRNSREDTKH
jgi:hypothetical protein